MAEVDAAAAVGETVVDVRGRTMEAAVRNPRPRRQRGGRVVTKQDSGPVRPFGDDTPARGRPPSPGIERKDDSGAAAAKDDYGVVFFAAIVAVAVAVVVDLGDPASEGREWRSRGRQ